MQERFRRPKEIYTDAVHSRIDLPLRVKDAFRLKMIYRFIRDATRSSAKKRCSQHFELRRTFLR